MSRERQSNFREIVGGLFREGKKNSQLTVSRLRQEWSTILGPELARRCHPARLSRGTLWINAIDGSWAYQLQFMKTDLLRSIQAHLESGQVADLRFKMGSVPSPETTDAPPPPPDTGTADTTPHQPSPPEEDPALQAIPDSALRNSFSRLRSGQRRRRAKPPEQV